MLQITLASQGGFPIWWLENLSLEDFFLWCEDFSAMLEAISEKMTLG